MAANSPALTKGERFALVDFTVAASIANVAADLLQCVSADATKKEGMIELDID